MGIGKLAAVCAAAILIFTRLSAAKDVSVEETFNKNRDSVQDILGRIIEASESEEFLVFLKQPRLSARPILKYSEQARSVYWNCARLMGFSGESLGSSMDCGDSFIVSFGPQLLEKTADQDEAAFTVAHEVMHLLLRHARAKKEFREDLDRRQACERWAEGWLRTSDGGRWLNDPLRLEKDETLNRVCLRKLGFYQLSYDHEADADQWALKLMEVAGFSPKAAHAYLRKRAALAPPTDNSGHYPWAIRAERLKRFETEPWVPPD